MAQGDAVQWIQIRDFKPGLSDDPGSNYPAGAAQRSGTYRCISNRNGALIPLPARQIPFSMPHNGVQTAVCGIYMPPVGLLPSGGVAFNPNLYPEHELFVGTEFRSGGNATTNVRRVRRYEIPGTNMDTIQSDTRAQAAGAWRPSGQSYGSTRSFRSDSRQPGVPVVIFTSGSGLLEFPDDQNTAANSIYQIFPTFGDPGGMFILNMCCHQGKVVVQLATAYGQGVNTQTFMGENMIWSAINDVSNANWLGVRPDPDTGATSTPTVMVPENPSGYAFMASMSANEIFAVKGHGGLYYTGDLDTAGGAVVSLPMVTGAEIQQIPAINNLGVIYGNRGSGIWVWTHGPACQLLSPMMSPDFWTLPSPVYPLDDFGGISYSLTTLDEWVITPNNFLYDTQTNGWWRLEDDTVLRYRYNTGLNHYLYCAESYYTDSYDTPVSFYARETPAASYSWQSHPQWESVDTLLDMREVTIRSRGSGTVKVSLIGESSSTSATFNVSSMLPILLRQPVRLQDANISVKIEATGTGTPAAAPTVYECNIGYFTAQLERVTASAT